jgi:stage V sporulation protein R
MGTVNHPFASGRGRSLPPELEQTRQQIVEFAKGYGLDFFDTIFLMCSYDEINMLAAYGGFPTRYPHWRFGMEYQQMSRGYEYGLQKIYEMVINTNPSFAFLLNNNMVVDQKLVMAHVLGHVDFFKNNCWFAQTNRKMLDQMANHATRVRRHINRHGEDVVEQWIDTCLSLDNLIDPHLPHIRRERERSAEELEELALGDGVFKLPARHYMDRYVNPPEFLQAQKDKREEEREQVANFPEEPQRDVLLFLLRHADLPEWKADILHMIREEAYYFAPQAQTKIMNEGWATYWHTKMMTSDILDASEVVDYCDHHSGTVATRPGNLNPYKLGVELYRHIERRWDKGQFGKAWLDCDDAVERRNWNTGAGLGREKIFEVRKSHNDVTFVDDFLTDDFVRAEGIFTWEYDKRSGEYLISSRDFKTVKTQILNMLSNHGQPRILVFDGNHANRGELVLSHVHEGADLQVKWAEETLKNLQAVWGRSVHLETTVDDEAVVLSHDGTEFTREERGE